MAAPDLTVVIPALDERAAVPPLLEALAGQRGIAFEVVVADGGSADGTPAACREAAARLGLAVEVVATAAGRGRQMNAGARAARAPDLLFLHADSALDGPDLLARARERMAAERAARGTDRLAGHFGVRFLRADPRPSAAYYFYEAKTRLGRVDCVNGDQGFWLSRRYFEELGGFDESLPYMEDARLARAVLRTGAWVPLPGRLGTSARRFEAEGLRERQTLNALLCNFDAIGFRAFFAAAAEAYRSQAGAGRLRLGPFLRLAHRLSRAEGTGRWLAYWYRTGGYVAENAWQLAFALDCGRNRRAGLPPGDGPTPWLDRWDRWGGPLLRTPPAKAAAAGLTATWFLLAMALSR